MENVDIEDIVYLLSYEERNAKPGGTKNPKNYQIITGMVVGIYKNEVKVELANGKRKRILDGQYFKYQPEAEQHCYKVANDFWKRECVNIILDELPDQLSPNFKPRVTSNPLRFAERNMLFAAQSKVWGSEENEQKIIQIIALTFDDIEVLIGVLKVLGFASDYAKKLLGKYLIVELNNLYSLLSRLKEFNKSYEMAEYQELIDNIKD